MSTHESPDDDDVLIWSFEHAAYWKPEERGYTIDRGDAGVYPRWKAEEIVSGAEEGYERIVEIDDDTDYARQSKEIKALKREALAYAEAIDNVREALGLESTHYQVIGQQVEDVVKALKEAQEALGKIRLSASDSITAHGEFGNHAVVSAIDVYQWADKALGQDAAEKKR